MWEVPVLHFSISPFCANWQRIYRLMLTRRFCIGMSLKGELPDCEQSWALTDDKRRRYAHEASFANLGMQWLADISPVPVAWLALWISMKDWRGFIGCRQIRVFPACHFP